MNVRLTAWSVTDWLVKYVVKFVVQYLGREYAHGVANPRIDDGCRGAAATAGPRRLFILLPVPSHTTRGESVRMAEDCRDRRRKYVRAVADPGGSRTA